MDSMNDALIIRLVGNRMEELVDHVAAETAFTLHVNGAFLVSLLCTPTELDTMAVGFLISEGLLSNRRALLSLEVDEKTANVFVKIKDLPENWESMFHKKTITSGCGKGITFTDASDLDGISVDREAVRLRPETVANLLKSFRNISELFAKTGGVHSAALADTGGDILLFSEDIGRHNAVDKLIGKAFLADISLHDKVLLSSGRVSGEIMTKVVRSRIPVLISRTAPTCMSITSAEDHGVTLIGFARGKRMNVYTHPNRLILDS
jgi:FdhD protein